jgi:hypothetical protein
MPAIPKDSPDLKPLVAYVMSLRPKAPSGNIKLRTANSKIWNYWRIFLPGRTP